MLFREHQLLIRQYLRKWEWSLEYAHNGELLVWNDGQFLELPIHTIWCKRATHVPNFLEILINEKDTTHFVFRRDSRIKRDLDKTFVETSSSLIALAPEIALLYKSNDLIHKGNQHDFSVGLEILDVEQRLWLKNALMTIYGKHQWLERL